MTASCLVSHQAADRLARWRSCTGPACARVLWTGTPTVTPARAPGGACRGWTGPARTGRPCLVASAEFAPGLPDGLGPTRPRRRRRRAGQHARPVVHIQLSRPTRPSTAAIQGWTVSADHQSLRQKGERGPSDPAAGDDDVPRQGETHLGLRCREVTLPGGPWENQPMPPGPEAMHVSSTKASLPGLAHHDSRFGRPVPRARGPRSRLLSGDRRPPRQTGASGTPPARTGTAHRADTNVSSLLQTRLPRGRDPGRLRTVPFRGPVHAIGTRTQSSGS